MRRKMPQTALFAAKVVRPSGFEPLAFRLGGGRSILLSYGRIWNFWCHWRTNYAHLGVGRSIQLSYRGLFICADKPALRRTRFSECLAIISVPRQLVNCFPQRSSIGRAAAVIRKDPAGAIIPDNPHFAVCPLKRAGQLPDSPWQSRHWAICRLMQAKVSSLISCSILHASARAVSFPTPSIISSSESTTWRS